MPESSRDTNALLDEQLAYYRARAREYDQWFLREGRYDRGARQKALWFEQVEQVRAALSAELRDGPVLELACGTGLWTERLAGPGRRVTAVDASPEVIEINEARLREAGLAERVRYELADLFTWRPESRSTLVFFGFWLSHVPPERFERFWDLVAEALAPRGRVFFVDNLGPGSGVARDASAAGHTTLRVLDDGREFEIVKVFYEPEVLEARLAELGWCFEVRATADFFLYGAGQRA